MRVAPRSAASNVRFVSFLLADIPDCANDLSSPTISKVNFEYYHSLRLKERIALHGSEEDVKVDIRRS